MQCDQIRHIVANAVIVYFGQFLENDKRIPGFRASFFYGLKLCNNFDEN
jgi:hypothetical protein